LSSDTIGHVSVSDLQSNIDINVMSISGTLNAIDEWVWDPYSFEHGVIGEPSYHFLALDFTDNNFAGLTMAQVSQDISVVDLLNREVKKILMEIKDVNKPLIITQSNGIDIKQQIFDINELILE
jgi:hypothetical protein